MRRMAAWSASRPVGRLAWQSPDGPTVVPVNFVVDGHSVRIRTAAYSAMARECDDSAVAFQVAQGTLYSVAIEGVNAATGTVQLNYRLVVPLRFTSWAYSGNQFQLQFTGQPGGNFVVQASAALTNWSTVLMTNPASGSVSFTDTNLSGLDRRCWRHLPTCSG